MFIISYLNNKYYCYREASEEKCPPAYQHQAAYSYDYNTCEEEDDRIEFKLRCPTIKSFRYFLVQKVQRIDILS